MRQTFATRQALAASDASSLTAPERGPLAGRCAPRVWTVADLQRSTGSRILRDVPADRITSADIARALDGAS